MKKILYFLSLIIITVTCIQCKKGPKIIAESIDQNYDQSETGIFSDEPVQSDKSILSDGPIPVTYANQDKGRDDVHQVVIHEILPTSKYVYLKVSEDGDEYWIATSKKDVIKGETYFYQGGLLKTNFESKEYNRVFDKVYLVSNIVPVSHGGNSPTNMEKVNVETHSTSTPVTSKISNSKNFLTISELVKNPGKYEGKTIELSGSCVKINSNIMGRNWIHLKDGSMDDYDLVITTDVSIEEGVAVTMQGVVTLDKDFGSGYKYDILIEHGLVVK